MGRGVHAAGDLFYRARRLTTASDGFGRLRPEQDGHDHDAFFRGGRSMFSGEVTPMLSLASAVSEYFENRWYVAISIYSLALVDGFGRMGHDAHWFSDVVGSGVLGARNH